MVADCISEAVAIGDSSFGSGVFALREFAQGELIFHEDPIVQIKDADAMDLQVCTSVLEERILSRYAVVYMLLEVQGNLEALGEFCEGSGDFFSTSLLTELRAAATELDVERELRFEQYRKSLTIFQSNAWRGDGCMLLYKVITRMNHSCRPNVSVLPGRGSAKVIALRDIIQGEELFPSYVDADHLLQDMRTRRQYLGENWGFWCGCSMCSTDADAMM